MGLWSIGVIKTSTYLFLDYLLCLAALFQMLFGVFWSCPFTWTQSSSLHLMTVCAWLYFIFCLLSIFMYLFWFCFWPHHHKSCEILFPDEAPCSGNRLLTIRPPEDSLSFVLNGFKTSYTSCWILFVLNKSNLRIFLHWWI